ncbi:YciK family oxidoreductase [Endozoicomonadaceae bacterium StTr2]
MFDYQASPDLLKGRIILVTGAGSGIGRSAAVNYAKAGATVILTGRNIEQLEQTYDAIEAAGGPQPAIYPMDLQGATPEDYEEMGANIEQNFGRLDGLLLNAGQLGTITPLAHYDPEKWMQVMQVNVNSNFFMTRALLPLLRLSEDASVIFTSSSVGRKGRAHWGAYSVSKFAVEGMMQVLADEEEGVSPVRVNSINPGATRTAMRASAFPAENPGTLPTSDEIMPVYMYLMGPDSKGVNGEAFNAQ